VERRRSRSLDLTSRRGRRTVDASLRQPAPPSRAWGSGASVGADRTRGGGDGEGAGVRHPRALQPGVWKRPIKAEVEAERWWRPGAGIGSASGHGIEEEVEAEAEAARRSGGGEARREAFPFFQLETLGVRHFFLQQTTL
jgi:hypothetical protein